MALWLPSIGAVFVIAALVVGGIAASVLFTVSSEARKNMLQDQDVADD